MPGAELLNQALAGHRVLALGTGVTLLGVLRILGEDGAEVSEERWSVWDCRIRSPDRFGPPWTWTRYRMRFWRVRSSKPADSQRSFARFRVKAFRIAGRKEAAERLAACAAGGHTMVLQEYVPGPPTNHYFLDGFVDRTGCIRALFVRQRLRMFPPDCRQQYPDGERAARRGGERAGCRAEPVLGAQLSRHLQRRIQAGSAGWRVQAPRDQRPAVAYASDSSSIIAYLPTSRTVTLHASMLAGPTVSVAWFDPASGRSVDAGTFPASGEQSFTPPSSGDWVLVMDSWRFGFAAP